MGIRTDVLLKASHELDIYKLSHYELALMKEPVEEYEETCPVHIQDDEEEIRVELCS